MKLTNPKSNINPTAATSILSIIGNGFDIQTLKRLGQGHTTSYKNFYDYATSSNINPDNIIIRKMEEVGRSVPQDANWSDIEAAIGKFDPAEFTFGSIQPHLSEIQRFFASFLNTVVTPQVLSDLDRMSTESDLAIHCLAHMIEDVRDPEQLSRISKRIPGNHGTVFKHTFINLNYTDLLDNYMFLDSAQFDPHPYVESKNNFRYNNDPRGIISGPRPDNVQSCQVDTRILHPHGHQSIPRSLLFGTGSLLDGSTDEARLTKPFRARYKEKYESLFQEADLLIIFGCSLGTSDGWWWENSAKALLKDSDKSLLLYVHQGGFETEDAAVDKFLQNCGVQPNDEADLRKQIVTIGFSGHSDHSFLGMAPRCTDCKTDPKRLGYKIVR